MNLDDFLLVLGAGASCEYGFSAGNDFKGKILQFFDSVKRDPKREDDHLASEVAWNQFRQGGRWSIDRFLADCVKMDKRDGAETSVMVRLGKEAIAQTLLPCEQELMDYKLQIDGARGWYCNLVDLLTSGKTQGKLKIVTFNYDRSLEYCVIRQLAAIFSESIETAAKRFKELVEIHHVYGSLGSLPELVQDESSSLGFGGKDGSGGHIKRAAIKAALSIRVVGDRPSDIEAVQALTRRTKVIGFLGFGFLDENMDVIDLSPKRPQEQFYISSGMNLSPGERYTIASRTGESGPWAFGDVGHKVHEFLKHSNLFGMLCLPNSDRLRNFIYQSHLKHKNSYTL